MPNRNLRLAIAIATSLTLPACSLVLDMVGGESQQWDGLGIDAARDASGRLVFLDTPRMWNQFADSVRQSIEDEMAGVRTPAKGWDARWCDQLAALQANQEHADRYVAYILDGRSRSGLAALSCQDDYVVRVSQIVESNRDGTGSRTRRRRP